MKLNNIDYKTLPQAVSQNTEDIKKIKNKNFRTWMANIPINGVLLINRNNIENSTQVFIQAGDTIVGTDNKMASVVYVGDVNIELSVTKVDTVTVKGDQGPVGNTGEQGPQGIQGVQGPVGPAGAYSETLLATLAPNATFDMSTLSAFDSVKFELFVESISNNGTAIEVISKSIRKENLVQKTDTSRRWANSVVGSTYAEDVSDASIISTATMITYMNANYPATNYSVGEKARGTDGTLPVTYYYSVVESFAIKRNTFVTLASGKVETEDGDLIRFTISNPSAAVYKLKVYGVVLQ